MTSKRTIALLLSLALLAGACGSEGNDSVSVGTGTGGEPVQSDPDDPFGQTGWLLVDALVDRTQLTLLETHPVTLQRDGNDVTGNAACNSYFGLIINGDLLFEGFGATEMACDPPAAMTLEFQYLAALGRVSTAESTEGSLVLTGVGVDLRFEQMEPTPDVDLEDTTWILETLIEGDTASSTINGTIASLTFTAATISGTDGCNTFQGDYEINGETLELGLLRLTARGCESGIARQAQLVGEVLAASPTIEIDGDQLIVSAPGALGLIYLAR